MSSPNSYLPIPLPPFLPHPLLRGGHAQTLAGFMARPEQLAERAVLREVLLPDGDRVMLHDDGPEGWRAGDAVALLIHGLSGCHTSGYMQRTAGKLNARGVRTFRMDLRGCGAGTALARFPYHSGRSEDAAAALRSIADLCPESPATLIGFSLGGNITLKLLGEAPEQVPTNVVRAIAVGPPVDLYECVTALGRGVNRFYDRYFARQLVEQVAARCRVVPDAVLPVDWPRLATIAAPQSEPTSNLAPPSPLAGEGPGMGGRASFDSPRSNAPSEAPSVATALERNRNGAFRPPRGVLEFDERFTAPVAGFGTAANYYRLCSSAQFVPAIRVPTLILAADDDPLVPVSALKRLALPPAVTVHLTRSGGHLGYIGRTGRDPDHHWMDWRIVEWCTGMSS